MKIIYVTDSFPPESVGGAGQVAFDLAVGMRKYGHDVLVLTTTKNKNRAGEDEINDVPVYRLFFSYKRKIIRSYIAAYNPFLRSRVSSFFKREKPDVVHFHNVHEAFSHAAIKWAKKSGAKVFLTTHDVLSFSYTRLDHFIDKKNLGCKYDHDYRVSLPILLKQARKAYNPFRNILIRHYINKYTDKVFSVSNALKKALVQNGIKNVSVVYNGINMNYFRAHLTQINSFIEEHNLGGKKIIFFGGRGMVDKGTVALLDSLPEIVEKCPDAVLVMAIEHGAHENYLKKIVVERGLLSYVLFSGLFHGKDLVGMFNISNVIVVPSIYLDPAPLMSMQAMAVKKPVVGTCFGGTPEIVKDNVTGYIINPHNTKIMAEKISEILNDPQKAEKFGNNGYNRLKSEFDIEIQISNTLEFYKKDF